MAAKKKKPQFSVPLNLFTVIVALVLALLIAAYFLSLDYIRTNLASDHNEAVDQPPVYVEQEVIKPQLPSGFPEDLPVYQNSTITESWQSDKGNVTAYSVVWETQDDPQVVAGYFQAELVKSGWHVVSETRLDNQYVATIEKNGTEGFIGVAGDGGVTAISATIGVKADGEVGR